MPRFKRKRGAPKERIRTRIKTGDVVEVIAGKERGKRGPVLAINRERNRVMVEGLNFVYRHTRPSGQNQQGGIIQREAFLHLSNVMVVDPESDRPTRIGSKTDKKRGKVRIARRSGRSLDKA